MKKRGLALMLAAVMVTATALTGCGGNSSEETGNQTTVQEQEQETADQTETEESSGEKIDGGTIIQAMPTDISSLNIVYETGDEGMTMLKPVYDPLYVVSQEGVTYYLAESHEISEDGLAITVKLRENLKWHDGEPITADDIMWNFEYKMNPDNGASSGTKVNQEYVSIEKVDDLTVKITLPSVSASYEATLGNIKLLPKHIYENEANISSSELNTTQGVGSGPFMVKEWKKGESLTLVRYEDYYRGTASIDTLIFKVMPNESSQEVAMEKGEINFFRVTKANQIATYENSEAYKLVTIDEGRINYLGFNSNSEIMKDIKAREAIAKALNVDEIVLGAYGSDQLAVPAKTVFTEQNFYYSDVEGYSQDLDAAKTLIEETGLAGKTLKLIYNSSRSNMEECALIIQQQLKNVGIEVEIQGYETQGFFEKFFYTDLGDWDFGLNGYSSNADNQGDAYMFSPYGFLAKNLCTTEEIGQLWVAGDATIDSAERADIYKQLQEKIRDHYTMVPISSPSYVMAVDKNLEGADAIEKVPVFEDYLQLYMTN